MWDEDAYSCRGPTDEGSSGWLALIFPRRHGNNAFPNEANAQAVDHDG